MAALYSCLSGWLAVVSHKRKCQGAGGLAQRLGLLGTPASPIRVPGWKSPLHFCFQLPVKCEPWEATGDS